MEDFYCKTKYESTSSHNKIYNGMNATNIIIYSYKYFSKVLFPCENQGVTTMHQHHHHLHKNAKSAGPRTIKCNFSLYMNITVEPPAPRESLNPIPSISDWVVSSSDISGITGSFDPTTITADQITISGFSCGPRVDSKADKSLNEDEEYDIVDATPSIEQISTRSSSDPCSGSEGIAALWVKARIDDEALVTFSCLVVFSNDGSTLVGLFISTFIFAPQQ
jgi:hypothetical protein